ncbi:NADH dehydrogenase [ubiquinone] 1 beta subcomplex subunit 7 [Lepeophtheirus salmonis]|uniref:NADH dehydrogenase [ubiquinone] 1 beta subcomplex subunit 7 n=1 Tax=Lepeophtheirus salmonis TaxID=72036 RepID=C1BRZ9_LEPSM|nr:NADH dehydrogenase [ubiquinone] 1 beta subcomplex subunit 7-like [Lepeophtheirus salmonis]ACO11802.1 Probable NADH dehydrogenase 1 beta subcomplex subunit 7 [Lepeophtheirus salmonis]ADD38859.1 NADH dehydrogenase 1 beta subcomplex subunit 7 [Lepeophtheirus salmonis]
MSIHVGRLDVPNLVKPTFDPNLGFSNGRKPREISMTEKEMIAAKVPPGERGYCARTYVEHRSCLSKKTPFNFLCKHELHNYHHCMEEDYILRIKEYEREKRLRAREERINKIQSGE